VRHQILEVLIVLLGVLARVPARAERSLLRTLRRAHATAPESAVAVPLGNPLKDWKIRRLMKFGAIQATAGGLLYLDESVWQLYRQHRRRRALPILAVALLIVGALWWAQR